MMQPNMMDFGSGPGGAMISGKWINRKTGEVINVRDSFIEGDNNMVLMTDKGQMSMETFTKYYIQASDEMYDANGKVIDNKPVEISEVANVETDLVADPIVFNNPSLNTPIGGSAPKKQINNFELIDKIFKKSNWEPNIEIDIKSGEDFPTKELNMLIDYFDVKIEDISEYIGNYVINQDLLREKISNYLRSNFNRKDSQVIVKTSKTKKTS